MEIYSGKKGLCALINVVIRLGGLSTASPMLALQHSPAERTGNICPHMRTHRMDGELRSILWAVRGAEHSMGQWRLC